MCLDVAGLLEALACSALRIAPAAHTAVAVEDCPAAPVHCAQVMQVVLQGSSSMGVAGRRAGRVLRAHRHLALLGSI